MSKPFKLRKIPLEEFLEVLTELYESGVDFIDLSGTISTQNEAPQDIVKITVKPEYMNKEMTETNDVKLLGGPTDDIDINIKLSDNDINDLI